MRRRDIIDVLCNFDIVHKKMVDMGETDFDKQAIYIKTPQIITDTKDTVIHELLHAHYYMLGKERSEEQINYEAAKLTKLFYNDR